MVKGHAAKLRAIDAFVTMSPALLAGATGDAERAAIAKVIEARTMIKEELEKEFPDHHAVARIRDDAYVITNNLEVYASIDKTRTDR